MPQLFICQRSNLFKMQYHLLADTLVSRLVGQLIRQTYRFPLWWCLWTVIRRPRDLTYFLKAMINSYHTLISKVYFSKVYFVKVYLCVLYPAQGRHPLPFCLFVFKVYKQSLTPLFYEVTKQIFGEKKLLKKGKNICRDILRQNSE